MRTVALLVLRILGVTAALSPADLGALEVDAVRLALTRHARTQPGRALCSELPLLASARECQHVFSAVAEAVSLERRHWPSFSSPLAVAPLLSKLQSEPSLGVDALFTFSNAIESLEDLAFWAEDAQVQRSSPELSARAEAASPPDRLAFRFIGAFESNVDGTNVKLSSEAFPILKQRRAALKAAESRLESAAKDLVESGKLKGLVSEDEVVPRTRSGRMVVPVLPADKRAVGIEVSTSRSGRTVFVEPFALAPLSAAARQAAEALEACEARLIDGLCKLLITNMGPLCDAIDAAAELDALLARASLSARWNGVIPTVGADGVIDVRDARHPLLALRAVEDGGRPVVGNTVILCATRGVDEGQNGPTADAGIDARSGVATPQMAQGLLLTGPNGGGKSVVLKTIALFAVLVRLGCPVPCATSASSGSGPPRVDFFTHISTDLADSQSLSDGASSFAAHLRSCKRALTAASKASGDRVLVVLDEPGASTDAVQGAAIARAVIESLLASGAIVLASTHSEALKAYGLMEPKLLTAAMAREADGLPSFTMIPGAVGSSHAFEAAAREGLPEEVIVRARNLLPNEKADDELRAQSETFADALKSRLVQASTDLEAARMMRVDAEAARAQARASAQAAAASLSKAESFLADKTRTLDSMIARLRKGGADDVTLVGETLRALRLAERDAAATRERALASLGLQPLEGSRALKVGTAVSFIGGGGQGGPLNAVDAVVADDAAPFDSSVKVSIDGARAAYVPRDELAVWCGGAADDFARNIDAWGTW